MNPEATARQAETDWAERIRHYPAMLRNATVLSLCGPSGVGKSTIARGVAGSYQTYIESTEGNPHLHRLLESRDDFDAAANQRWFLDRIHDYVLAADPLHPLVLDQDPVAVVLVYARLFLEAKLMTEGDYVGLFDTLWVIEERLQQWTSPRTVMCLDAPAETLHRRVEQRSSRSKNPPTRWFADVRRSFVEMYANFPNCRTVSSLEFSADELIQNAHQLIAAGPASLNYANSSGSAGCA